MQRDKLENYATRSVRSRAVHSYVVLSSLSSAILPVVGSLHSVFSLPIQSFEKAARLRMWSIVWLSAFPPQSFLFRDSHLQSIRRSKQMKTNTLGLYNGYPCCGRITPGRQ